MLVTASLDVGSLVLILAGQSFIGLARRRRRRSLRDGRPRHALPARPPLDSAGPSHAVFLLAFAANLAGDGLRDLLEDH